MKRGQFNFVWIFAILAGGAILFLAIYGAVKSGDTLRYASDTEIGKSISILTDPLQASFAEGSSGKITFQTDTRINNICFSEEFGKNDISVATRSDIGEDWNLAGGATSIHNKYIFSKEINEASSYSVLSKPFYFPYKVADLIFLIDDKYCFINTPDELENEISNLNVENIEIESSSVECSGDSEKVCFGGGSDCDIIIYGSCNTGCDSKYDFGSVEKSGSRMVYVGNLLYAAVFSDKNIYNCNVERLLFRASSVAEVFSEKADFMNVRDCNTNLKGDLIGWGASLSDSDGGDLVSLNSLAKKLKDANDREVCGLW